MMTAVSTDRIEKTVVMKAPRTRIWRALTTPEALSTWFGVNLAGATFAPGRTARGPITIEGYRHVTFEIQVEQMVPERLFSWRWHPYAIDPKVDYSKEPTTLVVFQLEEVEGGTRVTVVESGFDALPAHRRDDALRMNTGGWEGQLRNIERHVTASK